MPDKKFKISKTKYVKRHAKTPPGVHAVLEEFKKYLVEHCVQIHNIPVDLSLLEMSIEAIEKHEHPIPCPRAVPARYKARIQGKV